jgi:hypothetical protein
MGSDPPEAAGNRETMRDDRGTSYYDEDGDGPIMWMTYYGDVKREGRGRRLPSWGRRVKGDADYQEKDPFKP